MVFIFIFSLGAASVQPGGTEQQRLLQEGYKHIRSSAQPTTQSRYDGHWKRWRTIVGIFQDVSGTGVVADMLLQSILIAENR